MTIDERLRDVINRHTDAVEPTEDGWERIRERIAARQRRPRRQPLLAAAATAIVLAIVVAAVAVVRSDDRDGTRVETPPAASASAPSEIVAATEDGRIVVLDTTTGAELRSLADGADPFTTIAVTPDGATVVFDRPSGPDADPPRELVAVRTTGGEAQRLIGGAGEPAISPDGRLLAFVTYSPRTVDGVPDNLSVIELPELLSEDPAANVVASGTVSEAGEQIVGLSWAPDAQHLVFTLLSSPEGSYPRVTEISDGIQLDEAPIVPINGGSTVAGYLGDTGQLLGSTCIAGEEPDQRLRVIAIDPQSGQETRHLFRYPAMCGSESLSTDPSGRHVLALGAAGLYRWSEGDSEPTKVSDGVHATVWIPRDTGSDQTIAGAPISNNEILVATRDRVDVISADDGRVIRTLVEAPDGRDVMSVSVTADGQTVYYAVGRQCDPVHAIWRVSLSDGQPERIMTGAGVGLVSPNGQYLAYTPVDRSNPSVCVQFDGVVVRDLTSGEEYHVPSDTPLFDSPVAWSPDSTVLIVTRASGVRTLGVSEAGLRELGEVEVLGNGYAFLPTGEPITALPTGTGTRIVTFDSTSGDEGRTVTEVSSSLSLQGVDASGMSLLLQGPLAGSTEGWDLYRLDIGTTQPTNLASNVQTATWLPD